MKHNETLSLLKPFITQIIAGAIGAVISIAVLQTTVANLGSRVIANEIKISQINNDISDMKGDIKVIKEITGRTKDDVSEIKADIKGLK